jgi:isocitrate/isopropylmalate dehydrogenase
MNVAVVPGDGVGPEVVAEARKVVDALGLAVGWTEYPWGSAWWHEHGAMMAPDAIETLRGHDAIRSARSAIRRCPTPCLSGDRYSSSGRGSICG